MRLMDTKAYLQSRHGVRVVGKIGSFLDSGIIGSPDRVFSSCATNAPKISVSRIDGDHASVSFGEFDQFTSRKESYELDWCYEKDESTGDIFSKEVKPFLRGIFHGSNACVIAFGARGSGKTRLLMGSEENPGLAPMAVSDILSVAEENGGSVSVSCYEMCQDHIYDLLEPKGQEVQVLEDAARKIQLKGLSKAPVKSISDFNKLYFHRCIEQKSFQKVTSDIILRSHKGLILYVSSSDEENNGILLGKISFLDLAGYEDTKHLSSARYCSTESAKVNKSLFALLNVVYALNAKETYIPYRESKLTRVLQDFLSGSNGAVLITCLNPTLCQDTIHAVSMASRSCQVVNKHQFDSAKKSKSIPRFVPSCSPYYGRNPKVELSVKRHETSHAGSVQKKVFGTLSASNERNHPLCASAKKSGLSQYGSTGKKRNDPPSTAMGRTLFDCTSPVTNSVQDNILVFPTVTEACILEEEASASCNSGDLEPPKQEVVVSSGSKHDYPHATKSGLETDIGLSTELHDCTITETQDSITMGEISPPISERLREISNSLKLLSSQPLSLTTPQRDIRQGNIDQMEVKTPGFRSHLSLDDKMRNENIGTPQDLFRTRSAGLKTSLVQECLAFLNTANKEELKALKGIGEKRASYILELRQTETEPFKQVDDLKVLGLSSKQINQMMTKALSDL